MKENPLLGSYDYFAFEIATKATLTPESHSLISKLTMDRLQMDPVVDYSIHNSSMISSTPVFKQRYGFDPLTSNLVSSSYQLNKIEDETTWFRLALP
jgi:hypothetical protein